jgi:hypothetical protein
MIHVLMTAWLVLAAFCTLVIWAACAVGGRTEVPHDTAWRRELDDYWPVMPSDLDGVDIFYEKYGPPTGEG